MRNQPSTTAAAVASGSSRYPANTLWPRTTTSPTSPSASSTTASSTAASATPISTPHTGWPTVPGRRPNSGWLKVATGDVSVSP